VLGANEFNSIEKDAMSNAPMDMLRFDPLIALLGGMGWVMAGDG
jgi:hypothetical protein